MQKQALEKTFINLWTMQILVMTVEIMQIILNFNQSWRSQLNNLYKKYYNLSNNIVSKFVNSNVLEQQSNHQFEQNISTVKHNDPYKTTRIKIFWITKKWGAWCVKMS